MKNQRNARSLFIELLLILALILSSCTAKAPEKPGLIPLPSTLLTATPNPITCAPIAYIPINSIATASTEVASETAPTETAVPTTDTPTPTDTVEEIPATAEVVTDTPQPTLTDTPEPTETVSGTPPATEPATDTPEPTKTNTPGPTVPATRTPRPTATATDTPTPTETETPIQATYVPPVSVSLPSWLQIFFTDPAEAHAGDHEGGPDEILAAAIDQARLTVDVAANSLDLPSIRDALIRANQRGLGVRVVMESDNMTSPAIQQILDARIPVIGDKGDGIMNNTFMVIDRARVWTGSMNYTISGAYQTNNSLICIHSAQIAEMYLAKFNSMFTNNLFGINVPTATPQPEVNLNGAYVGVLFSPDNDVAAKIAELIRAAKQSIYFLSPIVMTDDIAAAIEEKLQAGILISGVFDASQGAGDPANPDIRTLDTLYGPLGDNIIIIDQKIVISGSYRLSPSAVQANDENVLIMSGPDVAAKYMQEFQILFERAKLATPTPELSQPGGTKEIDMGTPPPETATEVPTDGIPEVTP